MIFKNSSEIFDAGLATKTYNIANDHYTWYYRGEYFKTSTSIPTETHQWNECEVKMAKIEHVKWYNSAIERMGNCKVHIVHE